MNAGDSAPAAPVRVREKARYVLATGVMEPLPSAAYKTLLAWPMYAWRVLVPKLNHVKTDPLKRAILRLARAGVLEPLRIAELIDADVTLIERLQRQFKQDNLLLESGQIAANGKKLIENDDLIFFNDNEAQLGWIFCDGLTGDVLPLFYPGSLSFEDKISWKEYTPLPIDFSTERRPSNLSLVEAMRSYRHFVERRLRDNGSGSTSASFHSEPEDSESETATLEDTARQDGIPQFVRLVGGAPELIDVPVCVYITGDDPEAWHVVSGIGEADLDLWLENRLQYAQETHDAVRTMVSSWLAEALELFPTEPKLETEEEKLAAELPFLSDPSLQHLLGKLALARRSEELFRQDSEYFDLVVIRYYVGVEALLKACFTRLDRRQNVSALLPNNLVEFRRTLRDVVARLNVECPSAYFAPDYWSKTASLVRRPVGSPRVYLLFLLFHAALYDNSVAKSVFVTEPKVLTLVSEVCNIRNTFSAHDNPDQPKDEMDTVLMVRNHTSRITEVLGHVFFAAS